jgi:tetratricopeptide (TPR) repeat protein
MSNAGDQAAQALEAAAEAYNRNRKNAHHEIMEITPRLPDAVRQDVIALLQARQGAAAEALLLSRPELERDAEAIEYLAFAVGDQGRFGEAIEVRERARQTFLARLDANQSYLLFCEGRIDEAIAAARASVANRSDIPYGWVNLLYFLAKTNRLDELNEAFEDLKKRYPQWKQNVALTGRIRRDVLSVVGLNCAHPVRQVVLASLEGNAS